jgi:hypothetical protein
VRFKQRVFLEIVGVEVLDHAPDLDVGKGQRLRQILQSSCFDNRFLEDFSVKFRNRSIRPDRAGMDANNIVHGIFIEGDFDIRILAPLFCEDLDAVVIILVRGAPIVVAVHLAVENDGGSARSLRLTRHLQFIWIDGLKTNPGPSGIRQQDGKCENGCDDGDTGDCRNVGTIASRHSATLTWGTGASCRMFGPFGRKRKIRGLAAGPRYPRQSYRRTIPPGIHLCQGT